MHTHTNCFLSFGLEIILPTNVESVLKQPFTNILLQINSNRRKSIFEPVETLFTIRLNPASVAGNYRSLINYLWPISDQKYGTPFSWITVYNTLPLYTSLNKWNICFYLTGNIHCFCFECILCHVTLLVVTYVHRCIFNLWYTCNAQILLN